MTVETGRIQAMLLVRYPCIMRTTVAIDDELLAAARHRAQVRGETLGRIIEAALRRELAAGDHPPSTPPAIPIFTAGAGPRPGLDLSSNRAVHEALDEDLPLDRRR